MKNIKITYEKVDITEKEKLINLINNVLDRLERKEFFIPFSNEEINSMFDEKHAIVYGAYDNDKLVGTAQLYLNDEFVDMIKESLNIKNELACEFGGILVLPEYRCLGIMKRFAAILLNEARKREYNYVVAVAHPENIASNKAISSTGAKFMKTDYLGKYYRNMYLLSLNDESNWN